MAKKSKKNVTKKSASKPVKKVAKKAAKKVVKKAVKKTARKPTKPAAPAELAISKKDLFTALYENMGRYLYRFKFKTTVNKQEAQYLESEGIDCNKRKDGRFDIVLDIESYIDPNYKEDFINYINTDDLESNRPYTAEELEQWFNKCFFQLTNFFSTFTFIDEESLQSYDEWQGLESRYLEVPYKSFKMKELNKNWNATSYVLDDVRLESFVDDL